MVCHRIIVIYHLHLFIDLEQCKGAGVNIQRANVHLWASEIVFAFAQIVVDLLSPATQGVWDKCDLAGCIFLVKWDAKTMSHKQRPVSHLQSGFNVPTIEPFPGTKPVEHAT